MAFVNWDSTFETGIKKIDEQHQVLIDLVNRLFVSFSKNASKYELQVILAELKNYTRYHFCSEEENFCKFKYEKEAEHIEAHQDFSETVEMFYHDFELGRTDVTQNLLDYLQDWLQAHIKGIDKILAKCLKEQKAICLTDDKTNQNNP